MESNSSSNWEDAIDIDDSDLPSIHNLPINSKTTLPPLRPCSRTSNSENPNTLNPNSDIPSNPKNNSPIPGPAGAVQAAMNRRSHIRSPILSSRSDIVFEDEVDDGDFKLNPWLNAVDFLEREFEKATPVGSVVRMKNVAEKIKLVAGVVKSCVPNGIGDLFITLKDPTGTIGASVHRNAIKECNISGDITVGSVVILKQVAVFCPSRSTCYLNVTKNNTVKVFSKDSDRQNTMPSSKARYTEIGKQMKERSFLRVTRGEADEFVAGNEVRRDTTNTQHNASQVITAKADRGTPSTNSMLGNSNSMSKIAGNMADESGPRKIVETDIEMEDPKKLISSISNAEWTDEQLLELDCLDDMMF